MRVVSALLVLAACNRGSSISSTAGSDTLWGLTPADARGAVVISPRGVAMIEAGYAEGRKLLDLPDMAKLKADLSDLPFGLDMKLADFGMSSTRGAALFLLKDGMVAILPVVDRDKFLAKVKGTKGDPDKIENASCKYVRDYYACATSVEILAAIGKGDLKRHVQARGEIELVAAELPFGEQDMTVAAAIQLSRGAATLRGMVIDPPAKLVELFANSETPKIDAQHTSSFALVDMKSWLPKSPDVLVDDVTVASVIGAMKGPMSIVTPAGAQAMTVEQPLSDATGVKKLIDRCDEVPVFSDWLSAQKDTGVCHIKAPNWDMPLDVRLDGQTVRVGPKDKVVSPVVALTPIGTELAHGPWSLVFWGRGTMFAGPDKPNAVVTDELTPEAAMVIRVTSLLNELGLAARHVNGRIELVATVRTMFANPDDVVTKLLAISAKDVAQLKSHALAEPIARTAPSSPFASDFAAGHVGLLIPTTFAGAAAAIVVPALMQMRQTDLQQPPPQ